MSDSVMMKFFDDGAYTALLAGKEGTVRAAFGSVNGCPAYLVEQNGGAMNAKETEKMLKVLELAAKTGNPVVTCYDSKGADLKEGLTALTDAARLNEQIAKISGVVPQIAIVTGVCGGNAALAAASADVCIAVKGCELFLTPVFTAAAAGDKKATGTAEAAEKAGAAHLVAEDVDEALAAAAKLISMLPANNLSGAGCFEYAQPAAAFDAAYSADNAIAALTDGDSAVELMKGIGKNVHTVLATVAGNVCGLVATAGGKTGLCANCAAKTARFVRLCDSFNIPVVTVVDTDGFVKSNTEEIAGGLRAAARLAATYADATTAKIAVIVGKAVGAAYTALCSADLTIAADTALIAPIEPTAAVSVLYKSELDAGTSLEKDTAALAARYQAEVCSAAALVDAGLADVAVPAAALRDQLVATLDMLASKRVQRLPKKHGNMVL